MLFDLLYNLKFNTRRLFIKESRPAKPCLLPGCERMTDHRGQYCCAEHSTEHKDRQRNGFFGKQGAREYRLMFRFRG